MRDLKNHFAGWTNTVLGEVCSFKSGSGFKENYQGMKAGKHPFIKVSDLMLSGNEKYITDAQNWISGKALKELRAKLQPARATVFAKVGAALKLNRRRILTRPTAVDNNMMAAIPDETRLNHEFLYFFLLTQDLGRFSQEGAVPSVNQQHLAEINIELPPLSEQCKIAKILSTWDYAIETIEKLVTVAKVRQNGFIRELLSNKHWPEMSLGEIGDISSAGVDKKTKAGENPVRLLNYLDVLNKDYISDSDLNHWVTAPDRQIASCDIQKGDVFFTPSSEIRNDIAHSAVATEDINGAVYSYHVVRFRLHEPWDLNFRAYAFKSPCFYRQAYQLCEGSGQRYVLSQKMFRQMTVRVPPIKTQRIIGAILRTIDEEIAGLNIIATALRKEKKALMQQLLTGKRRVETGKSK